MTPADDVTGSVGNYRVMHSGRTGVAPGQYKVVVTKSASKYDLSVAPDPNGVDPLIHAVVEEESRKAPGRHRARPKDAGTISGEFAQEVPENGGVIDIDIKTASRGS